MAITLDGTNGITTPDLDSSGPITGTTGTFSGAVQASGVSTNLYPLVSATAVTCSGQTSIDFTGIPSWVKRITVMFSGVSTSGTSLKLIQLGSGSVATTTGYLGCGSGVDGSPVSTNSTAGLLVDSALAAELVHGIATICNLTGNLWVMTIVSGVSGNNLTQLAGASVTLGGALDLVRITTVNGTDTFDTTPSAGKINILYEG